MTKPNIWLSVSDLMTGLMVIFLFVAIAYISRVHIIRKTKRFSIPERAVQYLKTKRTTETPPIRP